MPASINFSAEVNIEQTLKDIGLLKPQLDKLLKKELTRLVVVVESRVVEERFGPTTTAKQLKVRTGNLRNSMFHKVVGDKLENLVGVVGNFAIYAPTHEFGRPRLTGPPAGASGRLAMIPLGPVLTASGVARGPARSFVNKDRESPDRTFWIKRGPAHPGQVFLARRNKDTGQLERLFLGIPWEQLAPIPPRLGIRDTIAEEIPKFVARVDKKVKLLGKVTTP